ncbi:hypothetical protein MWG07_00375 [Fusobacterium necrophorum]|uniref:Uncharacterized protein n=1 Tax=Fusobacterium necrophorum TaxID=859 RepID=A0AAW6W7X1_9FUSO|nr:hypothetical protein [Fusobacterium necrophorum]MDK4479931.1 hypothetical protein [Fusobacterium necrophorum]MDK4510720.1 hypothetical protein [Fusobacterium necrophorum]
MVKLSEILKTVNSKLAETFPDVEVDSKDLSEKFNRPSFRTELDGLKTSAFMTTYKEREFTIRIYFFPTEAEKGRIERLKITDKIEDVFLHTLWITETFAIPVEEIHFEETDGVLIASFDGYTMEEIENDITAEMMEELEYNVKS